MKKILDFKIGILLSVFAVSQLSAQTAVADKSDTRISIFVKSTDSGLTFTCEKGCEWKELSIKSVDIEQSVIQSGIKDILKKQKVKPENSEFIFTVERKNGLITLESIKGMRWEKLTVKCPENNCTQTIDENGVTQLN